MSILLNIPKDNKSGVYAIINQRNGRKYIGSSLNLKSRAYTHRMAIQNGRHNNPEIQKDVENGDNFVFKIIEFTNENICIKRSEIKCRTQLLEYKTIKNAMELGEQLYNQESMAVVSGRLSAEQKEFEKILTRKAEIEKMLNLSNSEILSIYRHNIYDKDEMLLFEKEILKRMDK